MRAALERSTAGLRASGRPRWSGSQPTPTWVRPAPSSGTSSLAEWDLVNERVHLGWTAYGPPWWGSAVNPACKLAMLGHAFDDCGFGRVKIQTDLINTRSQAAIAKLGATREGVLRRHVLRADGSWRDTVVFSILRRRVAAPSAPASQARLPLPDRHDREEIRRSRTADSPHDRWNCREAAVP